MVNKIGQIGEDIATKLLEDKGYKILERNFRTKIGEIDIVAEQNGTIVFVEVKARTSTLYGLPQESITKRKLTRLQKLAYLYLIQKNIQSKHFRIDVISIQLDKVGNIKKTEHIKEIE